MMNFGKNVEITKKKLENDGFIGKYY